jgi:hypothetical protein
LDMPPSARGTTVIALAVRKTTSAALMQTKQTLLNRLRPGNSVALRFAWMVLTVLLLPNDKSSATAATRRPACNRDGPPPFAAAPG